MKDFKKGQRITVLTPENAQFSEGSGPEVKRWFNEDYKKIEWSIFMYGEAGNCAVIVNADRNLYVSIPDSDIERRLKIYISGPITGIEDLNRGSFAKYEKKFVELGYDVVNPFKLDHSKAEAMEEVYKKETTNGDDFLTHSREDIHNEYMKVDLKALIDCDLMGLMNEQEWEFSKGCKMEIRTAVDIGLEIISLETECELYFENKNTLKILLHQC